MQPTRVPVEEFTTPDPIIANDDTTVDELWRMMQEHGIRHIPIARDGFIVGIVSDRDVRFVSGLSIAEKHQIKAADIMAPDPITVRADTPLDEVAYIMSEHKVGSVIVQEEDGHLLGILTTTDALNALIEIIRKGNASAD